MDKAMTQRLKELMMEIGAFKFGEFLLVSGKKSGFYCDARLISNHAVGGPLIGQLILVLMEEKGIDSTTIGGLEAGALPVSSHVQSSAYYGGAKPLNAFYVKKKTKTHGMKKRIEGNCTENDQVVIIEDVITTGGSALQACEAVKELGAEILAIVAVFDREEEGRANLEQAGYKVYTLLKRSEFGQATES